LHPPGQKSLNASLHRWAKQGAPSEWPTVVAEPTGRRISMPKEYNGVNLMDF